MFTGKVKFLLESITNNQSLKDFLHPITRLVFNKKQDAYSTKIMQIRHENDNVYTLVLKPQKKWQGFQAGQFISITTEINGRFLTRTFSISSAPAQFIEDRTIELTIQKQNHGKATPFLGNLLKRGDKVSISKAQGDFVISENSGAKLFIAGGSGITPIRSLIKKLAKESQDSITLIYYAQNRKHLFKDELLTLTSNHKDIKIHLIDSSVEGRICKQHLTEYCSDYKNREVYVCGPGSMIQFTNDLLSKDLPPDQIHHEYFGTPPTYDINAEQQGTVFFEKSETKVSGLSSPIKTLLELAESKGLKPKSSCRMGVCHQCVCKKTSGVIYNILTKTYSDSGAQNIQPCVSVAIGDVNVEL